MIQLKINIQNRSHEYLKGRFKEITPILVFRKTRAIGFSTLYPQFKLWKYRN